VYWLPKFDRIEERDIENEAALDELGWKSLVIWECETGDVEKLARRLDKFLSSD
jgi:DNA mismatch endonuclease (patch repair protein)